MVTSAAKTTCVLGESDAPVVPLFERLCDLGERRAFLQHRSRRTGAREYEALAGYILSDGCVDDLTSLLSGEFDYPLPRQLQLRKAHSDRRRIVYAYPERVKNLMKYINWGMLEYDDIFSDSLYSFRRNRGVADVFRRIARADYARSLFAVKADIHDYGHSIRPELLKPMLRELMGTRDPALLSYLEYLLDRGAYLRNDKVVYGDMGGLPGIPMGCFFNNLYLAELDRSLERQSAVYCRYADDIAVFTATRAEALDAIDTIRATVSSLGIALNEDKTRLLEPGEDIELLGIEIRDGQLDVADHTLAKARTKLTHYANKLVRYEQRRGLPRPQAAAMMVRRIDRYFYGTGNVEHELSWRDFFFHVITRPDSLHDLDLTCQDLIRRVATGKRGAARYRFRYADMQALGYRPLMHEYYRYIKDMNAR